MSQVYQGRRRDSLRRRAALAATLALTPSHVIAYVPKLGGSIVVAKNGLRLSNQNDDNGDFSFNGNSPFNSPRDPNGFARSSSSSANPYGAPIPRPGSLDSLGGYQFSSSIGSNDPGSTDGKAENDAYYAEKNAREEAAEEAKRTQASMGLQAKTAALLREAEAKRLANKELQNPTEEEANQGADYQWQMKAPGDSTQFFGQNNDEKMRRAQLEAKARSDAAAAARAKAEELRREWEAEHGQNYDSLTSFARAETPVSPSPNSFGNSGQSRKESLGDSPLGNSRLSSESVGAEQVKQTNPFSPFQNTQRATQLPSNPFSTSSNSGGLQPSTNSVDSKTQQPNSFAPFQRSADIAKPLPENPYNANPFGDVTNNIGSQQPGRQPNPFAPFQRSAESTNPAQGNPFNSNPIVAGTNSIGSQQMSTGNFVDSKGQQSNSFAPFQRSGEVTNPPPGNPFNSNSFGGGTNNLDGKQEPSALNPVDSKVQQTNPFSQFQRSTEIANVPLDNSLGATPFGGGGNQVGSKQPSTNNSVDSNVPQPTSFVPFQRSANDTNPPVSNTFSSNAVVDSTDSIASQQQLSEANSLDSRVPQPDPFSLFQRSSDGANPQLGNPRSSNPFGGSKNNKYGSPEPSSDSFAPYQRPADITNVSQSNPFSSNPFGSSTNTPESQQQPSALNSVDSKAQQPTPFSPFQGSAEVPRLGNPLSSNPVGGINNKFTNQQSSADNSSADNSVDGKVQQPNSFAPFQRSAEDTNVPPVSPFGSNPFAGGNNSFDSKVLQPGSFALFQRSPENPQSNVSGSNPFAASSNAVIQNVQSSIEGSQAPESQEVNFQESQSFEPLSELRPKSERPSPMSSSSLPVAFTPLDALAVNREAEEERSRFEEQRRRLEAKTQFLQAKDGKPSDLGFASDDFKAQQQAAIRVEEAERLQADMRRAEEARRQEEQANRIRAEQARERRIAAERNQTTSEYDPQGKGKKTMNELGTLDADSERLRVETELRRKAEEQARIARLEVARRQAAEEAEREKAIADENRRKADEARKAAIAAARKKSEEEQAAKRAAEEARKQEEQKRVQEARQRADELRYKAEAETNRQEIRSFVESKRREVNAKRLENEDRQQLDDEVRFRAEEAKRWAEEEARRKTGRPLGGYEEDEEASRIRNVYMKWCDFYGKRFDESRLGTFAKNLIEIERHFSNSGGPVQLNEYADLTSEQYRMREENPILWDEIERRRWDDQVPLQMPEPSFWPSDPYGEGDTDVIDVGPPREAIDAYDPVLQVDPWRREEEEWNLGRGSSQPSESEIIDKAKRRGEFEAKRKAELDARRKAEQEKEAAEKMRLMEEARVRGEAAARLKAEEEAKRAADEEARKKAVEEAQRRGAEEAKRKAEAELKRVQEERELEETRKVALEEAKRRGEAALRRKAEEEMRAAEIQREAEKLQGRQTQNHQPRVKEVPGEAETLKPNDPDVGIWRNAGNRMNLDDETRRKVEQRMGSSAGLPSYQKRGLSTPPISGSQESPMDAWNAAIKRGQEVAQQRAKLEEQKLAELAKLEEEKKNFFETVKGRAQEEALKRAEAIEGKRKEEEEAKKRLVEEAVKRAEEEQRKRAEAQARRRQEIEKLVEIEQKRKEEVKRIATEAALRREAEAKRLREEQAKKVEEERQRKAEANRRAAEEAKRKADETARRREERVRLALEEQQKKDKQRKEAAEIARRKAQEIENRKAEQLQQIQEEKKKKEELRRTAAAQLRADQEAREVARLGARRQAAIDLTKKLSQIGGEQRSNQQDSPPQGNESGTMKLEQKAILAANTTDVGQRASSESTESTSQQSSYSTFPSSFGSFRTSVESFPNATSIPENKRNYNPFQKVDTAKSNPVTSPVGSYLVAIASDPASNINSKVEGKLTQSSDANQSMTLSKSDDSRKNLDSDDDYSNNGSTSAAPPKRTWSPFKGTKPQATPSSQSPSGSYLTSVGNKSDKAQTGSDAAEVFEGKMDATAGSFLENALQLGSSGEMTNSPSDSKRNYNPFQKGSPQKPKSAQQPFGSYLESPTIAASKDDDTAGLSLATPKSLYGPSLIANTPNQTSMDRKRTEPEDKYETIRSSFPNSQPSSVSPFPSSTTGSPTTLLDTPLASSSRFEEESERRIQEAAAAALTKAEELRKEFEMKQKVGEAMPLKGQDSLTEKRMNAELAKRDAFDKREAANKAIEQAQTLRDEANKLQEANESGAQSGGTPSYMEKVAKSFVAGSTRLEQLNQDISRMGEEFTASDRSTESSEKEKRVNDGEEGLGGVPNLFSMFFGRSSRKTQEQRERINNMEKEQRFSRWEDKVENGLANQDGATPNDEGLPFFLSQRSPNGGLRRPKSEGIDESVLPIISSWGQTPEGSIHGFISKSPNFDDGAYIITTPVEKGAKGGSIVTTASGSQYRLSEERNSFETVRVDAP